MQPLISPVDHESRHNSYHGEDSGPFEDTPLLARFPPAGAGADARGSLATLVTVGLLLTVLLSGVVIGTYLLIEQGREENVLPPVEMAVQLVSRSQWDRDGCKGAGDATVPLPSEHATPSADYDPAQSNSPPAQSNPPTAQSNPPPEECEPPPVKRGRGPLRATRLVAVQTDSAPCYGIKECEHLLRDLLKSNRSALAHNFLVSGGGHSFEVRGWARRSRMFPRLPDALVVGFIGNFAESPPNQTQMKAAKRLLDESVSQQYLAPNYTIVGKRTKESPKYLFLELMKLPQWDFGLSDF